MSYPPTIRTPPPVTGIVGSEEVESEFGKRMKAAQFRARAQELRAFHGKLTSLGPPHILAIYW
jgi:hypothetical protein